MGGALTSLVEVVRLFVDSEAKGDGESKPGEREEAEEIVRKEGCDPRSPEQVEETQHRLEDRCLGIAQNPFIWDLSTVSDSELHTSTSILELERLLQSERTRKYSQEQLKRLKLDEPQLRERNIRAVEGALNKLRDALRILSSQKEELQSRLAQAQILQILSNPYAASEWLNSRPASSLPAMSGIDSFGEAMPLSQKLEQAPTDDTPPSGSGEMNAQGDDMHVGILDDPLVREVIKRLTSGEQTLHTLTYHALQTDQKLNSQELRKLLTAALQQHELLGKQLTTALRNIGPYVGY